MANPSLVFRWILCFSVLIPSYGYYYGWVQDGPPLYAFAYVCSPATFVNNIKICWFSTNVRFGGVFTSDAEDQAATTVLITQNYLSMTMRRHQGHKNQANTFPITLIKNNVLPANIGTETNAMTNTSKCGGAGPIQLGDANGNGCYGGMLPKSISNCYEEASIPHLDYFAIREQTQCMDFFVPPFGEANTISSIQNIPNDASKLMWTTPVIWGTSSDVVFDSYCASRNCISHISPFSKYLDLPIDEMTLTCTGGNNCTGSGTPKKVVFIQGGASAALMTEADTRMINPAKTYINSKTGVAKSVIQLGATDSTLSLLQLNDLEQTPQDLIIISAGADQIKSIIPQIGASQSRPAMIVAVNVDKPTAEGGNFQNMVDDATFAASDVKWKNCVMFPEYYQPNLTRYDMTVGNSATMDDVSSMSINAASNRSKVKICNGTARYCTQGTIESGGSTTPAKFTHISIDKYTAHLYTSLDWLILSALQMGGYRPADKTKWRSQSVPAICGNIALYGDGSALPYILPTTWGHFTGPQALFGGSLTKPCRSLTWRMDVDETKNGKSNKPMMMNQTIYQSGVAIAKVGGQRWADLQFMINKWGSKLYFGFMSWLTVSSVWFVDELAYWDNPLYYPLSTNPSCPYWNSATTATNASTAGGRRLGISSSSISIPFTVFFYGSFLACLSVLW